MAVGPSLPELQNRRSRPRVSGSQSKYGCFTCRYPPFAASSCPALSNQDADRCCEGPVASNVTKKSPIASDVSAAVGPVTGIQAAHKGLTLQQLFRQCRGRGQRVSPSSPSWSTCTMVYSRQLPSGAWPVLRSMRSPLMLSLASEQLAHSSKVSYLN